ncbi:MAG: flavodoxin [Clostridiales bacterium]|nr:flavodoxin [Clostridiales bacterium]
MSGKKLVAYFSTSGDTAVVAKQLAKAANADVFAIKPVEPYTQADLDWNNKDSRSSREMRTLERPAIAERVENMADYDVVFVGFPIWWYLAPTIINGFLESYDFSGKTIIPFATSGSSDIYKAEAVLRPLCKTAQWKDGKLLNGDISIESLKAWVEELNI